MRAKQMSGTSGGTNPKLTFRIGKSKAVRGFQAFLPADDRAFDLRFPPDIIVPINAQDESPTFCHWYNKITVNLLNYCLRKKSGII